jgi:hypothetical protein
LRLRALVFAGIMAGLAAVLQTAPVWLGEPTGFVLAVGACLPAAVAAGACPREAPWAVVAAALLCLLFSPQEAAVFAFTNGAMGLALGRTGGLPWFRSTMVTGLTLWAGMSVLTWGVGVAALGPGLLRYGWVLVVPAFGAFSLAWSALWAAVYRPIYRRIAPLLKTIAARA